MRQQSHTWHVHAFKKVALLLSLCLLNLVTSPAIYAKGVVLTLRPAGEMFDQIMLGILESVGDDFKVVDRVVSAGENHKTISNWITLNKPKAVVLIDDHAVTAYQNYQRNSRTAEYPPSIMLAVLSAERKLAKTINSMAIAYEVPAVASLVDLRKLLMNHQLGTVGTLYRTAFKDVFLKEKRACGHENINLIGIEIQNDAGPAEVRRALKQLTSSGVDAVWIMNDSALLLPNILAEAWIPRLRRLNKPVVVGVPSLVQTQFTLGDYVAYPNHSALGLQMGDMLFDFEKTGWTIQPGSLVPPRRLQKEINLKRLETKGIKAHRKALTENNYTLHN
jgi:hypothetical protein